MSLRRAYGLTVDYTLAKVGPMSNARQVESAGPVLRLAEHPPRYEGDRDPDRHVDEQYPAPGRQRR